VLHHAPEDAADLLAEAARVAAHLLVKDHFEHGAYPRTMLRPVDFVSSQDDRGNVPDRYFTREEFVRLAKKQHLVITALDSGLDPDDQQPSMGTLPRRDRQFIAVLRAH
jgi:hypothetical protein